MYQNRTQKRLCLPGDLLAKETGFGDISGQCFDTRNDAPLLGQRRQGDFDRQ